MALTLAVQKQIYNLHAQGQSGRQIALTLKLARNTVQTCLRNLQADLALDDLDRFEELLAENHARQLEQTQMILRHLALIDKKLSAPDADPTLPAYRQLMTLSCKYLTLLQKQHEQLRRLRFQQTPESQAFEEYLETQIAPPESRQPQPTPEIPVAQKSEPLATTPKTPTNPVAQKTEPPQRSAAEPKPTEPSKNNEHPPYPLPNEPGVQVAQKSEPLSPPPARREPLREIDDLYAGLISRKDLERFKRMHPEKIIDLDRVYAIEHYKPTKK